ncbi:uncharacterized protein LOC142564201 [Dermacentor variabilis]|uniref:uncharacterized protein LOC142564201 n=1 Tax=Dermacentor variabilis TaxID=34621 RepID=UPI003F5BC1E3
MVASRSERRRLSAHWDESSETSDVDDSAVSCSSATDLPGASPMTSYYLASSRSSSPSSLGLPCSRQQQQRFWSRRESSSGSETTPPSCDVLRQRQRRPRRSHHHHQQVFPETTTRTGSQTRSWTRPTTPCSRSSSTRRPKCLRSLLLLVLFFVLQQPLLVLGSGVFELRLGSFSNPSNRDSQGACCSTGLPPSTEGTPCPGSPCRVSFRVCLKHYQKTVDTDSPCTYGELSTPVLVQSASDGAIFNASRPPIRFPFEFSWPGTFSLIIEAWHEGPAPAGGSSPSGVHRTLVAQMSTQKWLDVGDSWTPGTLQRERAALSYSYRVRCQEYYYGSDCAKLCRPRDDKFGHYTCSASGDVVCLPGWKGDYCSNAICLKGCKEPQGDCDRPNECKCRIGWEGPLCDRCVRYPGCLHGTCSQPWQCNCDEGWGGLFCNQDLNYCTNNRPCRHGGTCTNTGQGSYTCSCLPGYAGTDCELVQDPCLASPCQNGGICRATDATATSAPGYTCSCPPGLGGRHCEVPRSACDSEPCANGASCREAPDASHGYRCLCPDAFAGDRCEVQRDPCEPSPCANGGTCVTLSDGNAGGIGNQHRFRCECRPGFEGPLCQTNVDDCVSNPCLNGASCLDGADSFRCLCRPGFVGRLCDHDVDDCLTYPCANGGRCVDLVNDFACNCPAGFSGKDCSVNLDECASSPCLNGGVCVDLAGRFECRCLNDFGGDRCEHRPPALAPRVAVVPPSPGRSSARRGGEDVGRHDLLTRDSRGRSPEEALSGVQLALIVTASVAVPLIALVAALLIVCQRRRWKERRDAEAARRQNERNAVQHHGMNNKGAGGKAPPPMVVVNALVEKPLQKKANGDNNVASSSTSAPPPAGVAKVLNVDARAQSKLSLDTDTTPEGVYASTRTLNRLYQEPGVEGSATMAVQHVLDRASLRGSSPKSCDSRVVDSTVAEEDDIASAKEQLQQQLPQPQPVTGGNNAVYVIEDHYRDENLLATEV